MTVSAVGTDGSTTNPGGGRSLVNADGALYEAVFRLCTPAPPFAEPWQSIAPPVDARGPILDPAHALRTLRQKFGDSRLRVAGVLWSAPDGSDHLAPGLVQPTNAPAGSYVEVRAEFRATQAAGGDGSHVRRRAALAKAEFLRAVDTKLIAPLRAAALAARTPVARDALLQFAAASEILHLLTPTICELLCHGNTDSRPARRKHAQYLKFLRTYGRLLPAVLKARAGVR